MAEVVQRQLELMVPELTMLMKFKLFSKVFPLPQPIPTLLLLLIPPSLSLSLSVTG